MFQSKFQMWFYQSPIYKLSNASRDCHRHANDENHNEAIIGYFEMHFQKVVQTLVDYENK